MTIRYRLRRFAVGKGTLVGKDHVRGRDRCIYMGPKGGLYYIGTRSVTTTRKKSLIVQYYRVYLRADMLTQEDDEQDGVR